MVPKDNLNFVLKVSLVVQCCDTERNYVWRLYLKKKEVPEIDLAQQFQWRVEVHDVSIFKFRNNNEQQFHKHRFQRSGLNAEWQNN